MEQEDSLFEKSLQGILDWIFVFMNVATMIPCRHVSWTELVINVIERKTYV